MLKKDELISAVLDGIVNANSFYENISNGMWLTDSAVESVMQTKIAESIFDALPKDRDGSLKSESIVMEYQIRDIIEESGSNKIRGKVPQLISGAKRVDLLIYNKNGRPIVPIEIKRSANADGFAIDASRIVGILKRSDALSGGSVKYGLICGFIYGNGDKEQAAIEKRLDKLNRSRDKIQSELSEQQFEFKSKMDNPVDFGENGWWAGGAICVYLRRKSIQ